jgi:hypothetical protein
MANDADDDAAAAATDAWLRAQSGLSHGRQRNADGWHEMRGLGGSSGDSGGKTTEAAEAALKERQNG